MSDDLQYFRNDPELRDFYQTFIPRADSYSIKYDRSKHWQTRRGMPKVSDVCDHLVNPHGLRLGVLSSWYPVNAFLDIDSRPIADAEAIRESLGMNNSNSWLERSESQDSYYLWFKPRYGEQDRPVTIKLLHEAMGPYIKSWGMELFPHTRHTGRLACGARSSFPLDEGREHLTGWRDKFYWMQKLDPWDVRNVPLQGDLFQGDMDYTDTLDSPSMSWNQRGAEWLQTGIIEPGTRNSAQFAVLYHLWRKSTPPETARTLAFNWLRTKHNKQSKTINAGNWKEVERELNGQIDIIWNKYILPDTAHNDYFGTLSREDIAEVVKVCRGNLPRIKFLFELVRWYRPRRNRQSVRLHSDHLTRWASNNIYNKRLAELEEMGIVQRGSGYIAGRLSKAVRVSWNYSAHDPLLIDNRSGGLTESLKAAFSCRDMVQLFTSAGMNPANTYRFVNSLNA